MPLHQHLGVGAGAEKSAARRSVRQPLEDGADQVKSGNNAALAFPNFFPGQGGLPIKVDGHTIGAISASGAESEIDEAIAQVGIDALLKSTDSRWFRPFGIRHTSIGKSG